MLRQRGHLQLVQPAPPPSSATQGAPILETAADAYASANPGCLVQVSAALRRLGPLPAFHPIELLDASIRGLTPERLLGRARR